MEKMDENFVNRELSWLMFNDRVLEEAYEEESKIFTRLKFLAIAASNLDEFFMVRIAGVKQQVAAKYRKKDISGKTPEEQLRDISIVTQSNMKKMYSCLNNFLIPKLEENKIIFMKYHDLNIRQKSYLEDFFDEFCFPALTPLAVDYGRPFPLLLNKSINIVISVSSETEEELHAVVQVPSGLPRFIEVHSDDDRTIYIYLEEIIVNNLYKLFMGYEILGTLIFRITRDAELEIDEDEAEDLLIEIEKNIKKRKWGAAVRLEIQKKDEKKLKKFLRKKFEINEEEIYETNGPLDLTSWFEFIENKKFAFLLDGMPKPFNSVDFFDEDDIFAAIKKRDRMIHLPYESFDKVFEFIEKAVEDDKVIAIKQTLYRVSKNSPIIDKLIRAVENGKQVTVVVELKARFDEANNILWARKLEKAGCHVVYGLPGLKIHCKAILVVRKEDEGIIRYVHLSTGNYNDVTAKIYEDIGMFTCREEICTDISNMFNTITGYSKQMKYNKIFVSPGDLRTGLEYYIDREIRNVKAGEDGYIIAKFNSLVDEKMILKFYEASNEGVKIDLIVRGISCLKPGLTNISENITVRSIVGTFLEHSRIYYFHNDGDSDIFLSSADMMERNLDRRIEIFFPVEEDILKERILNVLKIIMKDTEKCSIQQSDGTYKKAVGIDLESINSQQMIRSNVESELEKLKEERLVSK